MTTRRALILAAAAATAATAAALAFAAGAPLAQPRPDAKAEAKSAPRSAPAKTEVATFAGGCFWCTEADFDKIDGVLRTTSGYLGGTVANPTYEQVVAGRTGHAEAVEIEFDPARVSYAQLVEYYWRTIDPTVKDAQFCDRGSQYRTAIFVHDEAQRKIAEASRAALERSKPFRAPVVTGIVAAGPFYRAEEHHQNYAENNPIRYAYYRNGCGRDARLRALWGEQAGRMPK